jgi:hypothetical protein
MSSANPARAHRKNVGETVGGLTGGLLGAALPPALAYTLGSHAIEAPLDAAFGDRQISPEGHVTFDAGTAPEVAGAAGGLAAAASPWSVNAIPLSALSGAMTGATIGRGLGAGYHTARTLGKSQVERLDDMAQYATPAERSAIEAFRAKVAVSAGELVRTGQGSWSNAADATRTLGGTLGTLAGVGGAVLGGSLAGGAVHALGDSFVQPYDMAAEQARTELADSHKSHSAMGDILRQHERALADPSLSPADRQYHSMKAEPLQNFMAEAVYPAND